MEHQHSTIICPNCGHEFELDKAFAEHFEEEKRNAIQEALKNERMKVNKEREELEERLYQEALESAEHQYLLELEAKDKEMERVQKQLNELQKRTRQGSMELQGEALEVILKSRLEDAFPLDNLLDVKKGQSGADLTHEVINPLGQRCGLIVWEAKNTKTWNNNWLTKIKDDASHTNAQLKVIVSVALPDEITTFDLIDGVWVTCLETAPALASVLRENLIQAATLKRAMQGQQSKMETVYFYLTSPTFRDRVQRIVETWENLKNQIDSEERAMQKQWKERRKQLDIMIGVTEDMYTDISAIIGRDMPMVDGLSLEALPSGD